MKMTWSIATALVWILVFETLGLASGQLYTRLEDLSNDKDIPVQRISKTKGLQGGDERKLSYCMAYIPR
jgi:hypothetical protein